MSIALLCPTRGRKQQFERMVESAINTSTTPLMIFSASNGGDDYASIQYPIDIPTVYMWNDLAKQAMKMPEVKLFMLASDDIIFETNGWDNELIKRYNALENKIHCFHLQDSRDYDGTPHVLVTREWIDALGYFLPPIFLHWFSDSWTADIARANRCFTHLRDYKLTHDKCNDRGMPDETHSHIRCMGWQTRDKAVNDSCQHFLRQEICRLGCAIKGNVYRPGVHT